MMNLQVGDEVLLDTNLPFGWPRGIFMTGLQKGVVGETHSEDTGDFYVHGIRCNPVFPNVLIKDIIPISLENE